jgi:hypothetical protein
MQRCFASARRDPRSLLAAAYCRLQPSPSPQPKPVCHRPRTLGGEPGDSRGGGDCWSAQIAEGSKKQDDQAWPWSTYATEEANCSLSSRVAGCLCRTSELTTWLPWTRASTHSRLTSIHNVTVQFRMPCGVRQVIFLEKRAGKQALIQKCLGWRIKHLPGEQGMIKHQERCMRGHSLKPSPPPLSSDSAPAERERVWTAWNQPATVAALGHSGVKLRHLRPSTSSRHDRGPRSWFAVGLQVLSLFIGEERGRSRRSCALCALRSPSPRRSD